MQHSQMLNIPKNAIWLSFHHHLLKSNLETQIKAYAAVVKVQHADKRYLTVISSSTFENCSRNENNSICSCCKY